MTGATDIAGDLSIMAPEHTLGRRAAAEIGGSRRFDCHRPRPAGLDGHLYCRTAAQPCGDARGAVLLKQPKRSNKSSDALGAGDLGPKSFHRFQEAVVRRLLALWAAWIEDVSRHCSQVASPLTGRPSPECKAA